MTFKQIITTFDGLIEILNQEVDLLKTGKQVRATSLLPRKEFLQQQYMQALEYIKQNIKNFTPQETKELVKKQQEIDSIAQKSRDTLLVMIENNKKIVDEIVKNKVSNSNNYISYDRRAKTYGNVGLNININKKI